MRAITCLALSYLAACAFLPTALAQDANGGDPEEGQLMFNNSCRTCHVVTEGDHRLGPSLHDIIGREAGSQPDYGYSSAMANSDIVWDETTLDRFMANPDAVVPGHAMRPYSGIASEEDRATIIEYLESESGE